ncbi:MAG: integrin alpha, partial [Patescibacteria group bacterium]
MKKVLLFLLLAFPLATFAQDEYSISLLDKFIGEAEWDEAGNYMSSAGDVNGDGYDDVLMSTYYDYGESDSAGAVYLIYGDSDGDLNDDGQPDISNDINLSEADAKFKGESDYNSAALVSSAGDVNNDGYDDILIGAIQYDGQRGAAYLIYGDSDGDLNDDGQPDISNDINLSEADAKFIAEAAGDMAGRISYTGDVNGDGYDDIIIGAHANDTGGIWSGAAYLIYGDSDGDLNDDGQPDITDDIDLSEADAKFVGEEASDYAC